MFENNWPRGLWPLGLLTNVYPDRTTLFESADSKPRLVKLLGVPTSYVPWSVMEICE